ncbi:MAG: pyruvate, phosphate dikinase [Candidatus Eisenbacteria sp.]|nr:pyruvate, phosphate dikinase [Candidatus Eisenbacteria bacterium]
MSDKRVYVFGGGSAEGNAGMRDVLGGKGANLAEMTNLGIPVPAGFTISADVCIAFARGSQQYPDGLEAEVYSALAHVEDVMGRKLGDPANPLLLSVRSGARVSMPGMMDTVLNLGLNDSTIKGLIKMSSDERFAYDCYRRLVQMYSDVVLGVSHDRFELFLRHARSEAGVSRDIDLPAETLRGIVDRFKAIVLEETGKPFPDDPREQIWGAIGAVFSSWDVQRAVEYRRIHSIPDDWGTAINVMAMVFGNLGENSATGVAFTRNPSDGSKAPFGEYLPNAQGEDLVAGIRTPFPMSLAEKKSDDQTSLQERMPVQYQELIAFFGRLEEHYRDVQDVEFTIQEGNLWILQTRSAKRTAQAAVRIAVDMTREGFLDKREAVLRVDPDSIDQILHKQVDSETGRQSLARGLNASPGGAVGEVVFTAQDAVRRARDKVPVILVRSETSADDVAGMRASLGILTSTGGITSHAAVVARGWGKPCVVGCSAIHVDYEKEEFTVGAEVVRKGDTITIDGHTGGVTRGALPLIDPPITAYFRELMGWADSFRKLKIRTNADTPEDAERAIQFGAEGIGLCRTEHMFFASDRLPIMREMILARPEDHALRDEALDKLLPFQREDFAGIFRAMADRPVTIRLLDAPLHEFLPRDAERMADLAERMKIPVETVQKRVARLKEMNPMLGHRGCRVGITNSGIYRMQVRAIVEAACDLIGEGARVTPEIMIPLVGTVEELQILRELCQDVQRTVVGERGVEVEVRIGTMIEVPRAALTADRIAEVADFFSFGTNDLTQLTYGYSRDDMWSFVRVYQRQGILPRDPFATLDIAGVGQLVRMAVEKGRSTRPDLKMGICGEHGGDPASVLFCHSIGLDYVSCSPYRVPVARLAAAHAALSEEAVGAAV